MKSLKSVLTASLVLFTIAFAIAQSNPYGDFSNSQRSNRRFIRQCTEPFSQRSFNRDYAGLGNTNYYHLEKEMKEYTRLRCLTSEQIRRLALLFPTDREKYDYLTYALTYVFDIENFSLSGAVLANRNARESFYRYLVREGVPAGDYYNDPLVIGGGGYCYNGGLAVAPQYRDAYGNVYGQNNGYNNNQYGGVASNDPRYQTYDRRDDYNPNTQPRINSGYHGMMTYREFEALKERVRQNTLDKGKLDAAKSLTRQNVLTANQIGEITRLFNQDNNRLEYAKFAVDYAFDLENYSIVTQSLAFESNKKDLERYIESRRRR
jgi:hypothetical protein